MEYSSENMIEKKKLSYNLIRKTSEEDKKLA